MGTWSIPIDAIIAKAAGDVDLVVRKVTIDMFSRVIQMSPVDTGRFKGNWQCSLDAAATNPIDRVDDTAQGDRGNAVFDAMSDFVQANPAGRVTYLSNALPYAYRLEYEGWSKQAPVGMIRVTAREFDTALQAAAQK